MRRRSPGPHLELRTYASGAKAYRIRDGRVSRSCNTGDPDEARVKLGEYIAEKHAAPRRQRRLDEIPVADVIAVYAQDVLPGLRTERKARARLLRQVDFWTGMKLNEVSGAECRRLARERGDGAARRELQDLQAAINYHHTEGYHFEDVRVTLPAPGLPRERWLTRNEVAKLLWICWRTKHEGNDTRPLRHLARFILFGVYTGSRPGDCLSAAFRLGPKNGYLDTERGLYHRRPAGKRETKKRQPTIPIPGRLLAHLKRWEASGHASVVGFGGDRVASIKTAWASLIEGAGPAFSDVVPYTLRHTAATWMCQRGAPLWEIAGYLGTSEEMIRKHYGHHHPDHLQGAAEAVSARGRSRGRNGT
jgi:integrase